jgi:hypothetical protein
MLQHYKKKAGRRSNRQKAREQEFYQDAREMGVPVFDSFEELLEEGVKRLKNVRGKKDEDLSKNNLTGIEEILSVGGYLDVMIELNKYVFTIYSTSSPKTEALAIAFVVPLWLAKKIAEKIKNDLWYMIQNDNYDVLDCLVDRDLCLKYSTLFVKEDCNSFLKSDNIEDAFYRHAYYYEYPEKFFEMAKEKGIDIIEIRQNVCGEGQFKPYIPNIKYWNRIQKFYYFAMFFIDRNLHEYEKLQMPISSFIETKSYSSPSLYKSSAKENMLVSMLIEDPVIERKTLYYDLLDLLKELS